MPPEEREPPVLPVLKEPFRSEAEKRHYGFHGKVSRRNRFSGNRFCSRKIADHRICWWFGSACRFSLFQAIPHFRKA
jgi:hypothetical protein